MKFLKFFSCVLCLCLACTPLFAFNYGEALQKSIFFYEAQQAGPLPDWNRVEWRGDATMQDEVLKGWYDAGDHVKFNLPMSYSASMLGWAIYEYESAFEAAGQLDILKNNLRFALDYLMGCSEGSSYIFQVGNGTNDHTWWGPVEVAHLDPQAGDRPAYRSASGVSCVQAQTAAALAIGGEVLGDAGYISRARSLYSAAAASASDSVYNASNAANFYSSNSGPVDELQWAATWLYIATGNSSYLADAEGYVSQLNRQPNTGENVIEYRWGHCWDDSHYGAMIMLAKLTGKQIYSDFVEMHLNWWTTGFNGSTIDYSPGGMAWLTSWGALRHATTTAFLAFVYSDWVSDSTLQQRYRDFAENQIDYALGDNPRHASYVVGYGQNSPAHPHHRTAQGSWTDNMNIPANHRHILYGALVGGPDVSDGYKDEVSDFVMNEVACDYNAGFVGGLAKMYSLYGGNPLTDFPQPETKDDEFFVEGSGTGSGNSISMKLQINNRSGWPARVIPELKFRYFMDLSEVSGSTSGISTISHYSEIANTISAPVHFAGDYYYIEVEFNDGTQIWPGGNAEHAGEVQLIIQGSGGFDVSNDWSYKGFSSEEGKNERIVMYDGDTIIWGQEPPGGQHETPTPEPTPVPTPEPTPAGGCLLVGDVDGNGMVTIVDALMTAQAAVGIPPASISIDCADVNNDGRITILDALMIAQYSVGLLSHLPVDR